jgi:peptidyl-prolyl cis-trans isomerase SurA
MNKIKIISILILLIFINSKSYSKENLFIVYTVNDELITSIDLKKESNYLIALNNQLKNLNKKKILEIAEESILRETIKKIELNKFFDLKKKNPLVENYIKEFYLRLNLKNEEEFQKYLNGYGLSINFIKQKIQIEITWNKLIYEMFKNQIQINDEKIRKEIVSIKNDTNEKLYLLSEIEFEIKNKDDFNEQKNNISKSIKEIGFKNSANIYSISDSSKFGGEIGWITEKKLSKKIFNELINLNIGEYTNPINTGTSFIILKINEIKYKKKIVNIKQEVDKKIEFETERQLKQYSKIYYNKVKINTSINEL